MLILGLVTSFLMVLALLSLVRIYWTFATLIDTMEEAVREFDKVVHTRSGHLPEDLKQRLVEMLERLRG